MKSIIKDKVKEIKKHIKDNNLGEYKQGKIYEALAWISGHPDWNRASVHKKDIIRILNLCSIVEISQMIVNCSDRYKRTGEKLFGIKRVSKVKKEDI